MHNNKKCEYDNYKFDSYAERDDYIYQKSLDYVIKLIVKPKIIMQEGCRPFIGKKLRDITFTPDLLVIFSDMYLNMTGFKTEFRDTKPFNKKHNKFVLEPIFVLKWKWLQCKLRISGTIHYTSPSGNGYIGIDKDSLTRFTLTS